jgi:hypothetical protein
VDGAWEGSVLGTEVGASETDGIDEGTAEGVDVGSLV